MDGKIRIGKENICVALFRSLNRIGTRRWFDKSGDHIKKLFQNISNFGYELIFTLHSIPNTNKKNTLMNCQQTCSTFASIYLTYLQAIDAKPSESPMFLEWTKKIFEENANWINEENEHAKCSMKAIRTSNPNSTGIWKARFFIGLSPKLIDGWIKKALDRTNYCVKMNH